MHPVFQLELPTGTRIPKTLSYSTLCEIESCPLRWSLINGDYPCLGGAYPLPAIPAALLGSVVHGALERFAEALQLAGNPEPGSEAFLDARRSFRLRSIVQEIRQQTLIQYESNPRVDPVALASRVAVDVCIEEFKKLVLSTYPYELPSTASRVDDVVTPLAAGKQMISQPANRRDAPSALAADRPTGRAWDATAIPCPGTLAEVRVEIDDPPLRGLIDLVVTHPDGDSLYEFKTGTHKPEHELQSVIYGLLWWRRTGRTIRDRYLVYSHESEPFTLGKLDEQELEQLAEALRVRLAIARSSAATAPPEARPTADGCPYCPVRQLCDAYWRAPQTQESRWHLETEALVTDGGTRSGWRDVEIKLVNATATAAGFSIEFESIANDPARLTCTIPSKFFPGPISGQQRVRLLKVGLRQVGKAFHVVWSQNSEAFWINL